MTPEPTNEPRPATPTFAFRAPTAEDQEAKRRCASQAEGDRAALILRFPFVAHLAMHLEIVPVVDFRIPTAATDGRRIWIDPHFAASLTDDDRQFVFAHEVWHCALGHIERGAAREPERWNLAIDHEVNCMLQGEGMEVPEDAVLYSRWRRRPAEEVYELLGPLVAEPDDDHQATRGRLADVHGVPSALPEEALTPPRTPNDEPGAGASEEVGLAVIDPDYRPDLAPLPREVWEERLVAAAQRSPADAERLGGVLRQLLEALRAPSIPWQEILRQFITSVYGGQRRWLPPNRRHVSRGLYLPSRRTEALGLVVAVDTSGSTSADLPDFMAELIGLIDSLGRYELTLICCDEEVRSVRVFTPEAPMKDGDQWFDGSGGTDFRPVFEWVASRHAQPDVLVFLTDGYGPAPAEAPPYPVLWALTWDGEAPSRWGQVAVVGAGRDQSDEA